MTLTTPNAAGLEALEERLKQDLAWLELPAKPWVPRRIADAPAPTTATRLPRRLAKSIGSAECAQKRRSSLSASGGT